MNADSVAARCGLRAGDIVVRLCGLSADSMTHLMAQQTIASCGDTLEIIVERFDALQFTYCYVSRDVNQDLRPKALEDNQGPRSRSASLLIGRNVQE